MRLGVSGKYAFRVSFVSGDKGMSHTLVAHDEHDKRTWVTALRSVLPDGHEGRDNIKRLRQQQQQQQPRSRSEVQQLLHDLSNDTCSVTSSLSGSSSAATSNSSALVKRSDSSVSDRVVSLQEGAVVAVKRSGSSVSDNQVVYKDYPSLRLLDSPRQHLFNIPDDTSESEADVSMRSKRRRSGSRGKSATKQSRKKMAATASCAPVRQSRKRSSGAVATVTRPSAAAAEQSDTADSYCTAPHASFGWSEGHEIDLDDDTVTDDSSCIGVRGAGDGQETP